MTLPARRLLLALALSSAPLAAHAEPGKEGYTLFNPTPANQLRKFNTDRPSRTESPFTVDAGHFLVETDVLLYSRDREDEGGATTKKESFGVMVSNLKLGLTNNLDLQLILTPWQSERSQATGAAAEKNRGFGDTTVRLKYNFLGNDGGELAIGAIPYLKIPTHDQSFGARDWEGGLLLPVAISLPHGWDLGLEAGVERGRDAEGDGYHVDFISSFTLGHSIAGELNGYAEFYSQASGDPQTGWEATADFGLTYGLTPNVQLDAGVNVGVTEAADALNPFVGISARL